jgi:hypothetical protein
VSCDILKAASAKITYFCFIRPRSLKHRNECFGGPYCFLLMPVPELHDVTFERILFQVVFAYKFTFVPVLGSGGKDLHIFRLDTRLSCQLHAPATLSSRRNRFSAESGKFLVITSRSAVVFIDSPTQCVKFKAPLCTQFSSYVAS